MPGMGELVVILLIVLVVFGANKLPGIGDALGKSIRNFKKASSGDQDAAAHAAAGGSVTVDPPKKITSPAKVAQLDAGDGDEDEEWEEVVVRRKKKKEA